MTQYRNIPSLPGYSISEEGKVRDEEGYVMPKTITNNVEAVSIEGDLYVISRLISDAWGARRVSSTSRFRQPSR